jgi:hypothetical protein
MRPRQVPDRDRPFLGYSLANAAPRCPRFQDPERRCVASPPATADSNLRGGGSTFRLLDRCSRFQDRERLCVARRPASRNESPPWRLGRRHSGTMSAESRQRPYAGRTWNGEHPVAGRGTGDEVAALAMPGRLLSGLAAAHRPLGREIRQPDDGRSDMGTWPGRFVVDAGRARRERVSSSWGCPPPGEERAAGPGASQSRPAPRCAMRVVPGSSLDSRSM